jgi:hypothetical protein
MLFRSFRFVAMAVVLGAAGVSFGEVVFTGTVTPNDPAGLEPTTTVTIGPTSSTPVDADPRGSVEVNGGSQFVAGRMLVGDSDAALAKMLVTGAGTKASVVADGSIGTPTLGVGQRGSGYLRVDNGAWLQVGGTQSGVLSISPWGESPGLATVEVVGESSLLTVGRQLLVTNANFSTLNVRDGAVVRVGSASSTLNDAVLIQGQANIAGQRTELQTNVITVGSGPSVYGFDSVLRIADGAVVRSMVNRGSSSRAYVGSMGRVELDDGTFAYNWVELEGQLSGSGAVTGVVAVDATGQIEVGEGESLQISGFADVSGRVRVLGGQLDVGGLVFRNENNSYRSIEVEQGEFTVRGNFNNNVEGTIRLKDSDFNVINTNTSLSQFGGELHAERSTVRFQGASSYSINGYTELVDSELLLTRPLSIYSKTSGAKSLTIDGSTIRSEVGSPEGATLWIHGPFEIQGHNNRIDVQVRTSSSGVIRVADGASVDFTSAEISSAIDIGVGSSVDFSERATMFYEVAVALGDSNLTTPAVVGAKQLVFGNKLIIDASAVSEIAAGQMFSLFEADSLLGSFSAYSFPDLPGTLEFMPQQTETRFSLLVIDAAVALPGDYNADGCVDAADYTVLRDSDMQATNPMALVTWQTNYGRWLPGSGMPIPEPTAAVLFAMGLTAIAALRR